MNCTTRQKTLITFFSPRFLQLLAILSVSLFWFSLVGATPSSPENNPSGIKASQQTAIQYNSTQTTETTPEPKEISYTVQRGDSLSKIARAHGVSVQALAAINNLYNIDLILVGQRLKIPTGSSDASINPTEEALQIIQTALKYRGVRYRYGGMSSRGIDCSGLIARVMQIHGYKLPHNSGALYKHGTPVAKANLIAGDLVFFKTVRNKRISHVGMYIGEGNFIHASSAKGKVRIDTLLSGYYAKRYVGARRIVEAVPPAKKATDKPASQSDLGASAISNTQETTGNSRN